jgi:hypothetical protein
MDVIIKTEVLLNVLNTAIAYASFFNSPQLYILQQMQYEVYHTAISLKEIEKKIQDVIAIKQEIISSHNHYV